MSDAETIRKAIASMTPRIGKRGPLADYRGAQVHLTYGPRVLLGDVREVYRDDALGCWLARVTHFDGSDWPIRPRLAALSIMLRHDSDMPAEG